MNLLRWKPRFGPWGRSRAGAGAPSPAGAAPGPAPGAAAPAAPADQVRAAGSERGQTIRRTAYLALSLVAAALTVRAVIGERGLLAAHRSRGELARLDAEVGKWQERNAWLQARVKALREDPGTIERIARERLDYVRPGEITFLFPYDITKPEPGEPGPAAPGEFSPTHPEDLRR